jgi:threonylcarbamoyladenosine tRNA methylthiotransferase MtaB
MKIAIKTLGCKANRADSDKLVALVGGEVVEINNAEDLKKHHSFDVCIVNTCTVTGTADRKSLDAVLKFKKSFPKAKIVAFGCGVRANKDFFMGSGVVDFCAKNLYGVLKFLEKNFNKTKSKFNIESRRTRATVKIQDGCNNFCSYCIIPFVRGREKSFLVDEIMAEIKEKEKLGFKEIVLTGINIGNWKGEEKSRRLTLSELIIKILNETKIPRVRLSSIEPQNFDKNFEKLFTEKKYSSRFCPHMHMSLQSGSDRVLKAMRRHYDTKLFKKVAQKLKKMASEIALTTDVIVGFPGETEKDFLDTCRFVKEIGFAKVHVFPYSKRAGTLAALMDNQVPENLKKERAKKLQNISDTLRKKFIAANSGKTFPVLIEHKSKNGYFEGFTPNYIKAKIRSTKNLENQIVNIKL